MKVRKTKNCQILGLKIKKLVNRLMKVHRQHQQPSPMAQVLVTVMISIQCMCEQ